MRIRNSIKITCLLFGLALSIAVTGCMDKGGRVYSAKMVCSHLEPFPTVFHWSEVNIHNPAREQPARITKKFLVAGKQGKPSEVKPYIEEETLDPNTAFDIDCDDFQNRLGLPLSTPLKGFVEVESDRPLAVVAVYNKCARQPRTDVFSSSEASLAIDLDDGRSEDLSLRGQVVVKKGWMKIDPDGRTFRIPTEIVAMELKGESELLEGEITVRNNPDFQQTGEIVGVIDPTTGEPLVNAETPAHSYFDVLFRIDPANPRVRDEMGSLGNRVPSRLRAQLLSIPPGPVQERSPAVNEYCADLPVEFVRLKDGTKVGKVRDHCHGPNPEIVIPPPEHAKVPCEDVSIDVEYVQAVLKK